jgi:hypothetical protein
MMDFDARIEALQSELLKRRAHTVPWGRWSAYQHGMTTFRILEAWDRPQRTRLAGLALAAASLVDEPGFLADLIGEEADRLARLVRDAGTPTAVVTATGGGDRSDVGEANAIQLASLAGSACADDGSPGRWLPLASQLAAEVRHLTPQPPQAFAGGTELVSKDAEAALLTAYRRVTRSLARPDAAAQAALADAARAVPWVAEPLVVLGLMRLAEADAPAAAEYGTRASEILVSWNCAWDKRLSEFAWYALAKFLEGQGTLEDDEQAFSAQRMAALLEKHGGSPCEIFAHLDAVGVLDTLTQPGDGGVTVYGGDDDDTENRLDDLEFDQLPPRFQSYLACLSDDDAVPNLETYPSLSARPWWDPDDVAVTRTIAELADDVFAELHVDERLRGHGDSPVVLVRSASRMASLARLLAEQRDVVAADDGIRLIRVDPANDALVGGRAASNLRLRCVVAVGDGAPVTVVVDEVADTVQRGECLVFDPTFPHEFRSAGDGPATVLCVDIWHPELTPSEVQLLAGLGRYVRSLSSAQQKPSADPASAANG